jgi:hypothetical protein
MTRLTSRSDGRGRPLKAVISGWAAGNPRIRRVWLSAGAGRVSVVVELVPVGDSEETMAVWMAHCDSWRRELRAQVGEPVNLDWYDPDTETPAPPSADDGKTLVYERAS